MIRKFIAYLVYPEGEAELEQMRAYSDALEKELDGAKDLITQANTDVQGLFDTLAKDFPVIYVMLSWLKDKPVPLSELKAHLHRVVDTHDKEIIDRAREIERGSFKPEVCAVGAKRKRGRPKKFVVGDSVLYRGHDLDIGDEWIVEELDGKLGVVICFDNSGLVGVRFDNFKNGHDLDGFLQIKGRKNPGGWWCDSKELVYAATQPLAEKVEPRKPGRRGGTARK